MYAEIITDDKKRIEDFLIDLIESNELVQISMRKSERLYRVEVTHSIEESIDDSIS